MNGLENQILSIIFIIFVLGFLIYRQLRPRKIGKNSLIYIPVIILFFIVNSLPTFQPTQTKLIEILFMSIVSIVLGLLACRELHVYKGSTGKAMMKGSWTYFLWWLAAFVIKSVLSVLFGENSLKTVNEVEILLPVFFLMTTRNAYLYWQTRKLGLTLH